MIHLPERTATAVIPVYNEEHTVPSVMLAAANAESITQVIAVNDGSSDSSMDVMKDAAEDIMASTGKECLVVAHAYNRGKAETLITGVNKAKTIGGASLHTLVFLDADLSPLSSRDTPQNQKIGAKLIRRFSQSNVAVMKIKEDSFELSLSEHINALAEPVLDGGMVMNIGMLHRTPTIDAIRLALSWGALSGNRALTVDLWDAMQKSNEERGLELRGWEAEAALNTYCRVNRSEDGIKLNRRIGKFVMDDVVNVGSRVKSGGLIKGFSRMGQIHFKALSAFIKYA